MSDSWINVIPEDPLYIPGAACQDAAVRYFHGLAPDAEKITVEIADKPRFFDCGENFEKIICPLCRAEIELEWWQSMMSIDYVDEGFELNPYELPCCGAMHTLDKLQYQWPQGIACFSVKAMNPQIGQLEAKNIQELEKLLGTKVKVIYQHI